MARLTCPHFAKVHYRRPFTDVAGKPRVHISVRCSKCGEHLGFRSLASVPDWEALPLDPAYRSPADQGRLF